MKPHGLSFLKIISNVQKTFPVKLTYMSWSAYMYSMFFTCVPNCKQITTKNSIIAMTEDEVICALSHREICRKLYKGDIPISP